MGATKTEQFNKKHNELALMLKAMAHPARIAIIEYLLKTETCICNDIVNVLPLAQPTVSQHLKELKNAGLIKGNIEGKGVCYCIDEKVFFKLQRFLTGISMKLEAKNTKKCC